MIGDAVHATLPSSLQVCSPLIYRQRISLVWHLKTALSSPKSSPASPTPKPPTDSYPQSAALVKSERSRTQHTRMAVKRRSTQQYLNCLYGGLEYKSGIGR
ncbi:hypothetical protein BJX70DRAFT_369459 [Aspergillus crustosus]